jgi:hypothetical protein
LFNSRGEDSARSFADPSRGEAQTLTVGTPKRWMATAYDKATEMLWAATRTKDAMHALDLIQKAHHLQERGHLRVEISVRTKPLNERLGSTDSSRYSERTP